MTVIEAFERAAEALPTREGFAGVELVAHSARRAKGAAALVLVVDRPGGVDLDLCERIAGRLSAELDAATPDEPYTLEVESAGLDRPLARPVDFERFAGSDVKIVTTLMIGNAKTHRGRLLGIRGTNVILRPRNDGGRSDDAELPIPLQLIKSARIEYDVRADLSREKRERRRK